MISLFLRQRLSHIKRLFDRRNIGQIITAGLFLGVLVVVGFSVFLLLQAGFDAVAGNAFLERALPYFIYEIFLLTVFALVFASALITGLFLLFQNDSHMWVLASPSYGALLYEKTISITLASIWPLLVIAVPALAAMQSVFSIGLGGFIAGFLVVLLLGLLAVGTAVMLILLCASALRALSESTEIHLGFSSLLSSVSVISLGLFAFSWLQLSDLDLLSLFQARNLEVARAGVENIREYFGVFPTHIGAETLLAIQAGATQSVLSAVLVLGLITAFAIFLLTLFSRAYLPLWQHFQEGSFEARPSVRDPRAQSAASVHFSARPLFSIFKKEWITMSRDKRTLFWLGFLTLLWLIVTGFDVFIQNSMAGETVLQTVTVPQFIQVLQLVVVGYFVAALVLRLVFPAFSMERDTAWSIMTAPISLKRLFWAKALYHVIVIGFISLVISGVHITILQSSLASEFLFVLYVLVSSMTLTLVGLSIGALFPNFTTDDPEKLSTTLPGLGFVGVALVYCALGAYSYYLYFSDFGVVSAVLFFGVSAFVVVVVSAAAVRYLPTIDFAARVES